MKNLNEYRIPYVGLKNGLHSFLYSIGNSFFTFFENSPVTEGKLHVDLTLDKKETLYMLTFIIKGTIVVECDRCGDDLNLPIDVTNIIYIKFENEEAAMDDEADVLYINRTESHIDVSQLIYEYIVLSIPIQKIHPDDATGKSTCDEKVLAILNKKETEDKAPDDRWAALNKLKN